MILETKSNLTSRSQHESEPRCPHVHISWQTPAALTPRLPHRRIQHFKVMASAGQAHPQPSAQRSCPGKRVSRATAPHASFGASTPASAPPVTALRGKHTHRWSTPGLQTGAQKWLARAAVGPGPARAARRSSGSPPLPRAGCTPRRSSTQRLAPTPPLPRDPAVQQRGRGRPCCGRRGRRGGAAIAACRPTPHPAPRGPHLAPGIVPTSRPPPLCPAGPKRDR